MVIGTTIGIRRTSTCDHGHMAFLLYVRVQRYGIGELKLSSRYGHNGIKEF